MTECIKPDCRIINNPSPGSLFSLYENKPSGHKEANRCRAVDKGLWHWPLLPSGPPL